jgi:hypothetical protein
MGRTSPDAAATKLKKGTGHVEKPEKTKRSRAKPVNTPPVIVKDVTYKRQVFKGKASETIMIRNGFLSHNANVEKLIDDFVVQYLEFIASKAIQVARLNKMKTMRPNHINVVLDKAINMILL